jgi:hemerythrin-like domain-containing protein
MAGNRGERRKKLGVSLATRIATEHLAYRSLIEEIETDLDGVRAKTTSIQELLKLLRSFFSQVRGHFALEEKGGLFEVYREHDLSFHHQAGAMMHQHRDFLERMSRILATMSALERSDGPEFEQCARELRDLFGALRAHEQAEDALLDRLVEQDIRREG